VLPSDNKSNRPERKGGSAQLIPQGRRASYVQLKYAEENKENLGGSPLKGLKKMETIDEKLKKQEGNIKDLSRTICKEKQKIWL